MRIIIRILTLIPVLSSSIYSPETLPKIFLKKADFTKYTKSRIHEEDSQS